MGCFYGMPCICIYNLLQYFRLNSSLILQAYKRQWAMCVIRLCVSFCFDGIIIFNTATMRGDDLAIFMCVSTPMIVVGKWPKIQGEGCWHTFDCSWSNGQPPPPPFPKINVDRCICFFFSHQVYGHNIEWWGMGGNRSRVVSAAAYFQVFNC